jgi:hypothetical protein
MRLAILLCAVVLASVSVAGADEFDERLQRYESYVAAWKKNWANIHNDLNILKAHPDYGAAVAKAKRVNAIAMVERISLDEAVRKDGIVFNTGERGVIMTLRDILARHKASRDRQQVLRTEHDLLVRWARSIDQASREAARLQVEAARAEAEHDAAVGAAMIYLGQSLGSAFQGGTNCVTSQVGAFAYTNCY